MALRDIGRLFLTGKALRDLIGSPDLKSLPSERRDCASRVMDFLFGDGHEPGRIMALYGLRRCGKTTLMLQCAAEAIRRGVPAEQIALMDVPESLEGFFPPSALPDRICVAELAEAMDGLWKQGVRVFFIDEATCLHDFEHASRLANDLGRRGRVLVSGTDSLVFPFAERRTLYDRMEKVHMTHVPYAEHSRLASGKTIDAYIEDGGLFVGRRSWRPASGGGRTIDDITLYVNTAIVDNILHVLDSPLAESAREYAALGSLDRNLIRNAIQRIVNVNSHDFFIGTLQKKFADRSWGDMKGSAANDVREVMRQIAALIDDDGIAGFLGRYEKRLGILEWNEADGVNDNHLSELRMFLKELDLLVPVNRATLVFEHGSSKFGFDGDGREKEHSLLALPGMRWSQVCALMEELTEEIRRRTRAGGRPVGVATLASAKRILSSFSRGPLLEEIVLVETIAFSRRFCEPDRFQVVSAWFREKNAKGGGVQDIGDIDMVVCDTFRDRSWCFEVKHSSSFSDAQAKHLNNGRFCEAVAREYAPVVGRIVLYRGKERRSGDVRWLNVETFLREIHRDFLGAMESLLLEPMSEIEARMSDDPMGLQEIPQAEQTPEIVRAALTACCENADRQVNPEDLLPFIRQDLRNLADDFRGRWMETAGGPGIPPRLRFIRD